MKTALAIAFALGVLFMNRSSSLPRGIRNNNPGNIRENARVDFDWLGEAESDFDPEFEEFKTPEAGIRAMSRILDSYARRGLVTIREVISTWAPAIENNTDAYIVSVARRMDIPADFRLTGDQRPALIEAIIHHENGVQPYTRAQIETGIAMA